MDNCHLLAVLLATVGTTAGSTTTPKQELIASLNDTLDDYEGFIRDQDVDGIISLFTDHPLMMDPRFPVYNGTDGIEEYFNRTIGQRHATSRPQEPNIAVVYDNVKVIVPLDDQYAIVTLQSSIYDPDELPGQRRRWNVLRQMMVLHQNNDDKLKLDWVFTNARFRSGQ